MKKKSKFTDCYVFFMACVFLAGCATCGPESSGLLSVHFINVGYGDATLIVFPDSSTMLIDAGPKEYSKNLISYLKRKEIKKIDTAVITHPHKNHFEGFASIAQIFPIQRIFVNGDERAEEGYSELIDLFREKRISMQTLKQGQTIAHLPDGIVLDILNPNNFDHSVNDSAMVLLLRYKETSFLFTSDIGPDIQEEIIKKYPVVKNAACVQVPHHGGPLSNGFLKTFPKATFVMLTGNNPWGLPAQDDLEKIGNRKLLRTDKNGSIVFENDGASIHFRSEK
ncbi:MAG: MBL fold metallo-hydrolase [Candidatus Omnitrophota bacterium]